MRRIEARRKKASAKRTGIAFGSPAAALLTSCLATALRDVELAAYKDALLAIFFLEDLDPFGGEENLGRFILL
jgi:hypothetical protein